MGRPQFSLIITCHNQCHFIADAIQSALDQNHLSREVIVVDDASTDGSDSVLKGYGDKIRLVKLEKNEGVCAARNAGAAVAQGDYLVHLDGDDVLKLWALSVYDQIIQARKPVLILSSLSWFRGDFLGQPNVDTPSKIKVVSYNNWVEKDRKFRSSASALIVERQTFESIGGWSKDVWPFEDQYLTAELADSGRAIQILEPPTVFYRVHSDNTIHNVPGLIAGCYRLVAAWESSKNLIGKHWSLARSALIGGPAFWAVKEAFRAGLSGEGLRLFKRVWPWVAAAALHRTRTLVFGRRPTEVIAVQNCSPRASYRATA